MSEDHCRRLVLQYDSLGMESEYQHCRATFTPRDLTQNLETSRLETRPQPVQTVRRMMAEVQRD
jgi:hypothetical protein